MPKALLSFCIHFQEKTEINGTIQPIAKQFVRGRENAFGERLQANKKAVSRQNHQKNRSLFVYISQ